MQVEREIKFSLTPAGGAPRRAPGAPGGRLAPAHGEQRLLRHRERAPAARGRGVALPPRRRAAAADAEGRVLRRAPASARAPNGRCRRRAAGSTSRAFPREEILAATGLDLARLATRLRPMFETRFARRSAPVHGRRRDARRDLPSIAATSRPASGASRSARSSSSSRPATPPRCCAMRPRSRSRSGWRSSSKARPSAATASPPGPHSRRRANGAAHASASSPRRARPSARSSPPR